MGRVLKNEVGKRIRALRKSRGIAPGEIADACDMTPDAIYRLESGYGDFPARVLTAYADILGMSVDYLLGRPLASNDLTIDEKALLNAYRACNLKDRVSLFDLALLYQSRADEEIGKRQEFA